MSPRKNSNTKFPFFVASRCIPQGLVIVLLFLTFPASAQTYPISGKVVDERYTPLKSIEVHIKNQTDSITAVTNKDGNFITRSLPTGTYYISITAHGYDIFHDTINNTSSPSGRPGGVYLFMLSPTLHMLDEVKIVQKCPRYGAKRRHPRVQRRRLQSQP